MTQEVELHSSVGYALKVAATALRTAMDAALDPLGLTVSQYSCLELLAQRPGLSSAALARGTFLTRQSMQVLLQGLQDRGLVDRPASAAHGRALPVALTPHGAQVASAASRVVADVERRMLDALPAGHQDRLLADLRTCTSALTTDGDGALSG